MIRKINEILLTDSVFTPDECDAIIREFKDGPYEPGRISSNQAGGLVRQSQVRFVPPTEDQRWLFTKLAAIAASSNEQTFGFDIGKLEEGFQFTKYESGDHYSWHADVGDEDERSRRKISITVQLNDDYEGGELQFFPSRIQAPKRKALVAVFPSFLVHRVAPVLSGTRYSLVAWVAGPHPFK